MMTIKQEYAEAVKQLEQAWAIFNNEGSLSSIYHLKAAELRVAELHTAINSEAKKTSENIISDCHENINRRWWTA